MSDGKMRALPGFPSRCCTCCPPPSDSTTSALSRPTVAALATRPQYMGDAAELIEVMRGKTPLQVAGLMDLSDELAALNVARYAAWSSAQHRAQQPPGGARLRRRRLRRPAGRHARRSTTCAWAQQHLVILSGLYGVLRPLDKLQPYRLEMGTAAGHAARPRPLCLLGRHARRAPEPAAARPSARRSSSTSPRRSTRAPRCGRRCSARVVECVFEDWKDGQYKIISFFAKRARGHDGALRGAAAHRGARGAARPSTPTATPSTQRALHAGPAGVPTGASGDRRSRARILPVIAISQFAGTSVWFAINAVMADLQRDVALPAAAVGWLTAAVQVGFIAGTFGFALLSIADRFSPRKVFLVCSLLAAALALATALLPPQLATLLALRFATGIALAGIYPVGMKIAAGWFAQGLGWALGVLVGALVLGTALPFGLRALGAQWSWQAVMLAVAGVAAAGGVLMAALVPDGPHLAPAARITPRALGVIWHDRSVRASAFGYFGHMWELYAFFVLHPGHRRAALRTARPRRGGCSPPSRSACSAA